VRTVVAIGYAPPWIAISLRAESSCPVWCGQERRRWRALSARRSTAIPSWWRS